MAIAVNSVDTVCTHAQLANVVGGTEKLERLIPTEYEGDSETVRAEAYDEVIRYLEKREPPIYESDLARPAELTRAVAYGAAYRLNLYSMTSGGTDDVFAATYKHFKEAYDAELAGLSPTTLGTLNQGVFSIGIGRR